MIITSQANPKIKWIRKLHERKARQECGCFYAEGLRIVIEAVQLSAPIETLITAPELLTSLAGQTLLEEQRLNGVEILEVSPEVFQAIALKEAPVGIAAVIRQNWLALDEVQVLPGDLWVALEEVADPGNLGTILRTNDGVGGKGMILLDHSTDPYDPTAVRASMGALFSQHLVKTTFDEFVAWKQRSGVALVGTSGTSQTDYQAMTYPAELVVLMGSERSGLTKAQLNCCDAIVRIPMVGRSDSLNLAVATALVIYEVFHQKREQRKEI